MSYIGINMATGKPLVGLAHLKASIRDILITPIGSRVIRRDYGSNLFELIDSNINPLTMTLIYASTAAALKKWEPRVKVKRVQAYADAPNGKLAIDIDCQYLPDGRDISIEGLVL